MFSSGGNIKIWRLLRNNKNFPKKERNADSWQPTEKVFSSVPVSTGAYMSITDGRKLYKNGKTETIVGMFKPFPFHSLSRLILTFTKSLLSEKYTLTDYFLFQKSLSDSKNSFPFHQDQHHQFLLTSFRPFPFIKAIFSQIPHLLYHHRDRSLYFILLVYYYYYYHHLTTQN